MNSAAKSPIDQNVDDSNPSPAAGGTSKILYADDNRCLAEITKILLTGKGYEVEIFSDGFEAWNRLSENPRHFHVLITDHRMPGFSGLNFWRSSGSRNFPAGSSSTVVR